MSGGWDLSCPDWEQRLKSGRSLVPALPLNAARADKAVKAFNMLRLADVPGTPYLAEASGDWFRDVVRALFGSMVANERLIRELFLLVPKKNSKTSYGALMMLVALILNLRPRATFIMTAPVHDVAELAFAQAAGAVALDPVLSKVFHIREHLKTITHRRTQAELAIMTFDPAVLTGQKVSGGALIDELHVVAKMPRAASAVRQLRGGMLPFAEAFLAFITTQSEDAPTGVFHVELQKARAIRDGRREGAMLPVLYEFPEAMQKKAAAWRDPANWPMVTPNAGRSITIERLREDFATAEATGEAELRAWASQHLNVEIGLALHADRWPGADYWERQAARVTLLRLLRRCEVICAGIDGGGLDDLLALALVGRDASTGEWLVWAHAWANPIVLERRKSEATKLLDLEKSADLTICETGEDAQHLAKIVARVQDAGLLYKVGVDAVGIGAILDALEEAGVQKKNAKGEDVIIAIPQGYKLMGAIKTTERKLAEGALKHGGQRLMSYAVGNAKVETKGNAVLVTKAQSGTAKIDPLMATFNAISLMALNPPGKYGPTEVLLV